MYLDFQMKTRRERTLDFQRMVNSEWSNYYWNFIYEFQRPLFWNLICKNPNLTWDLIQTHIDFRLFNWETISINPNITEEIVRQNMHLPWCWTGLSLNPNITWNLVKDNIGEFWNWKYLLNIQI